MELATSHKYPPESVCDAGEEESQIIIMHLRKNKVCVELGHLTGMKPSFKSNSPSFKQLKRE